MPGHLGPAPGPWDGWVATAFVNRMMLRMETLGGVLGSYRPGPGGGGDSGKLWWVGHRPLEIQDSSRGSGCGVHSTTGPEHQQLPFHTFSGSPHLPGVGAPGTGCLEPLLSGVPRVPAPGGPAGARPLPVRSSSWSSLTALPWAWVPPACGETGAGSLLLDGEAQAGEGGVSESPKQPLPAFEESHVEDGRVGVDELEQESLEDQPLLEALLRLWNL